MPLHWEIEEEVAGHLNKKQSAMSLVWSIEGVEGHFDLQHLAIYLGDCAPVYMRFGNTVDNER